MRIDRDFVEKFVKSWESRHDDWVKDFLADAIGSENRTFHGIRLYLKDKLEKDWRISLGFLLDRTTYQSRKDVVNIKTANYLFYKMCSLSPVFSEESLKDVIQQIRGEKRSGKVTHIREDKDIERLESFAKFIIKSNEKNITRVILNEVKAGRSAIEFLNQFHQVGQKTASFYMKFLSWIFQMSNNSPDSIVIDTHVMKTLISLGEISRENTQDARKAIIRLSKQLNLPEVEIETALYEASWQNKNRSIKHCS